MSAPAESQSAPPQGADSPPLLDLGLGVVFAVAGAGLFAASRGFPVMIPGTPVGPGLIPSICGAVFMIFGVLLALSAGRKLRAGLVFTDTEDNETGSLPFALLVIGGLALVIFATPYLGFVAVAAAYSFAVTVAGGARWWGAALSAIGVTLLVYVLFSELMRVPLPTGMFF